MIKDAGHHIHTPDSWARGVASLALQQALAAGGLKQGGPAVNADVNMTVQVETQCVKICCIINGVKICFCV
jgi:hypothetical protein